MSLTRLLYPRSIAFIGGTECDIAITRTRELGFTGKIWAVHPKREQLGGIPTIKSVDEIGQPIDAAFIAVKREPTIEIVRSLKKLGCGGAVIYASGFAETGDTHLQDELLQAAAGMPLLGPNCYGYVNALDRAALWPDEHGMAPCTSGVAIITQSGNIACNFTMTMRALPVACVCAIGNQADVDMARMIETFAKDERITAIGLHMEGLPDIPAFAEAALTARARKKSVIALKTGRSPAGAKVAMTHTATLAGPDTFYDALFERYGVARMKSVTAFAETLKFLHYGGALEDNRIVSMSCSGGEAALVADMAMERNLCFPGFDPAHAVAVGATLHEYAAVENPLDYHTFFWNQPEKLTATFTAVLAGEFDVAMLMLDTPTNPRIKTDSWFTAAKSFMAAADTTKARAAIVASLPECMPQALAEELAFHHVVPMMGLDDALTAFEAASFIGRNWARPEKPLSLTPTPLMGEDEQTLGEFEAKRLLQSHGVEVPQSIHCKIEDAEGAAQQLGFPVVLKISCPAIFHKTEAGGVALDLQTPEAVKSAAARMKGLASHVLVERMVKNAVAELIVGLTTDPQFGLVLLVGAGGIFTEFIQDKVALLLPASRLEIERALKSLKVWKLIEGFRGKAGDEQAVIHAIEAIAAFAEAHRGLIVELDVNPLLILPQGAVAVDALVKMRKP
ncbi:MAG TPA: acetate--CoA ligase family protein [Aestuariivirga sp.]|nr:acetate--CoA ligase family protein [Aestuariivirga sp.]